MSKEYTRTLLGLSQHLLLIFVARIPVRNERVNVTLVLFCAAGADREKGQSRGRNAHRNCCSVDLIRLLRMQSARALDTACSLTPYAIVN